MFIIWGGLALSEHCSIRRDQVLYLADVPKLPTAYHVLGHGLLYDWSLTPSGPFSFILNNMNYPDLILISKIYIKINIREFFDDYDHLL